MLPRSSSLLNTSRSMLRPNDMLVAPDKDDLGGVGHGFGSRFHCRGRMQTFGRGVHLCHGRGQLDVDTVLDRDRAEIGILAVEAPCRWLVGMFEPVIADDVRVLERGRDVGAERGGASAWFATTGPAPRVLGRPEFGAAKRELADQQRLAAALVNGKRVRRIGAVAIERDDVDVSRRSGDRWRRTADRRSGCRGSGGWDRRRAIAAAVSAK